MQICKKIAKGLNTQSGDSELERNYRVVIKGQCVSGISSRKLPKSRRTSPKTTQYMVMSPKQHLSGIFLEIL